MKALKMLVYAHHMWSFNQSDTCMWEDVTVCVNKVFNMFPNVHVSWYNKSGKHQKSQQVPYTFFRKCKFLPYQVPILPFQFSLNFFPLSCTHVYCAFFNFLIASPISILAKLFFLTKKKKWNLKLKGYPWVPMKIL